MKLKLDEHIHYIAEDKDGVQYFYENLPAKGIHKWHDVSSYLVSQIKFDLGNYWGQSLHKVVRDDDGYVTFEKVPYRPNILIDTKVIVWENGSTMKFKRFFAGWSEDGKILCFMSGATSWSCPGGSSSVQSWGNWEIVDY